MKILIIIVVIAILLFGFRQAVDFFINGKPAVATVTSVMENPEKRVGMELQKTYIATVEFALPDGTTQHATLNNLRTRYSLGSSIDILYDPNNPSSITEK